MHLVCGSKKGSAMVESCVVMMLLCLILFGLLQVSYLVGSRNVIRYTAVATARAAAVGMNDFMLHKISHFTSIATAGPVRTPSGLQASRPAGATLGALWDSSIARDNKPVSELGQYEMSVREAYLLADTTSFDTILDYDNWQSEETDIFFEYSVDNDEILTMKISQTLPLVFPFSRVFFGLRDEVEVVRGDRREDYPGKLIEVESVIEDHSDYYLKSE